MTATTAELPPLAQLRDRFPDAFEVREPLPRLGLVSGDWFAYARRLDPLPLVEVIRPGETGAWRIEQIPADRGRLTAPPDSTVATAPADMDAWNRALQAIEENQ